MTLRPDNTLISNREMLTELVLTPLRAIGRAMENFAISNARTQALQEIAAIPDDKLAATGMTRAELISRTFRHDG